MSTVLAHYLESVRQSLRLDTREEREVIAEFEDHIEDQLEEMKQAGLSEEEAARRCLSLLGSAKLVAHQFYETHSQGTWKQVSLASIPHLLFAALFTLNWWQNIVGLGTVFLIILWLALYGWRQGGIWAYSALGYSLVPVAGTGLLLVCLPGAWSLIGIPVYFLLASWWLYMVMAHTLKRDWLFSSLMLLPLPIMVGWFLAVAPGGRLNAGSLERARQLAPYIGLTFLALALAIAMFLRLRQRPFKIMVLILSGLIALGMVHLFTEGGLGLSAFVILILVMWGLFTIPALLDQRLRRHLTTSGR